MVGHINEDGYTYPVATIDCDQYYAAQDSIKLARFYAAANYKPLGHDCDRAQWEKVRRLWE